IPRWSVGQDSRSALQMTVGRGIRNVLTSRIRNETSHNARTATKTIAGGSHSAGARVRARASAVTPARLSRQPFGADPLRVGDSRRRVEAGIVAGCALAASKCLPHLGDEL